MNLSRYTGGVDFLIARLLANVFFRGIYLHVSFEEIVSYLGVLIITIIISSILTFVYINERNSIKKKKKKFDIYHNYISLLENYNGMAYRCLNDENWTMKYVSKKTYELIGYLEDEIIDNKIICFEEIIHPKYRENLRRIWENAINNHEDFQAEYIIITKKNTEKWVFETGHAVYNDKGEILYIEGFIEDITASKDLLISERKNQAKFRNLIENSQDAIFIDEDGLISYTNPACISFFRANSMNELIGKKIEDLLSESYIPFYRERIDRINKSHLSNPRAPYEFVRFDGTIAYAEVSSSPYFDQDHVSIFVFIQDVTERIKREKDIRKVQKRNRDLIIEMSEGIGVFSKDDTNQYILVFQNKGFSVNLLGEYTRLLNVNYDSICNFIPKEDNEKIFNVISSGDTVHKKYQLNNRFLDVRFFTNVDHELVMMVKDTTEVDNALKEVQIQASRLENIINGTNVGTWEWNIPSGEIHMNNRWAEMLGYDISELTPQTISSWENLVHPDDLQSVHQALENYFLNKIGYYHKEYRMIHKDGHHVWILDTGSVSQWDADGKPLMMFGTHLDITLSKEKEIELEYVSNHDFLTGVYNRRAFENYIVQVNQHDNYPICMIMADVNQLKYINDHYGHDAGDNLLCKVSQTLSSVCRPHFVSRTGGDEFMIIIKNSNFKKTDTLLNEIKNRIADLKILSHPISVAFGISCSEKNNSTMKEIIRDAEIKMYIEKDTLKTEANNKEID